MNEVFNPRLFDYDWGSTFKTRAVMAQKIIPFLILCLLPSTTLRAQDPQRLPESADAAVTERRVREEAEEHLKAPPKEVEVELPEEKKEVPPVSEQKFFVHEVILQGHTVIPTEKLRIFTAAYEGREISLTEAGELAQTLEKEFRRQGYVTAVVYIPPQKIQGQTLMLAIVEGRVGKQYVEGERWFSKKRIFTYSKLKEGEILHYQAIQASIRRMNQNPDREVRSVLRSGETPGTTDVYFKVKDHFPLHSGFQFDNGGVRSTGVQRYGFTLKHNDALIPDSRFLIGTLFGKAFGALFLQHMIPMGPYGTKAIYGFTHSQANPLREFKGSDINGHSQTYSMKVEQPLSESELFSSSAFLELDFKDSRTKDISGTRRRDRLRVLKPGVQMRRKDRYGFFALSQDASFGIAGLGATGRQNPFAGRAGAPPDFIKFSGRLQRGTRLPLQTVLVSEFSYQWALHKLTPQEQFYLGGGNSVRGYPEGDYLADQGIIFTNEFLVPFFLIPADWKLPRMSMPLRQQIQIAVFVDQGYGRLRGPSAQEIKHRYLLSLGGGLKIYLSRYLSMRLEIGHALGNEPLTESDHTRFHFRLAAET